MLDDLPAHCEPENFDTRVSKSVRSDLVAVQNAKATLAQHMFYEDTPVLFQISHGLKRVMLCRIFDREPAC